MTSSLLATIKMGGRNKALLPELWRRDDVHPGVMAANVSLEIQH